MAEIKYQCPTCGKLPHFEAVRLVTKEHPDWKPNRTIGGGNPTASLFAAEVVRRSAEFCK